MTSTTRTNQNQLHHHLHQVMNRHIDRTPTSKQYAQQYRPVLADKSSLGLGFSPELKEACYPIVINRSEGARLWDVDGNEYIDILMGLGINLFGHNPSFVKEAIVAQLDRGIQLGAQAELAGEVAELIHDLTGVERVAFSNTGTEAIMTAIRLARAATHRNKIAVFTNSYHGHCDHTLVRASIAEYAKKATVRVIDRQSATIHWLQTLLRPLRTRLDTSLNPRAVPAALGIPNSVANQVFVLDYGNPRSLEVIGANRRELAAVLVEPVQSRRPELQPREFLQQLRQVTQTEGIALIFDEMVTGFRIHPGGAQAWFDVEADLVTYSKIIGGGLPLSVIAGKSLYLDRIDGGMWYYGDRSAPQVKTTFFAGTFCKHPLALAAAKAVLSQLKTSGSQLQDDLNRRTAQLVQQINTDCMSQSIPLQWTQFGSFFALDTTQSVAPPMATNLLSYLLLNRGIHLRQGDKGGFLSIAHTDADVNAITQAFQQSLSDLKTAGWFDH